MIFDTHCHLYDSSYEEDAKEIIKKAFNNNVGLMMIPGDTLANSQKALDLADSFENVYCAVGVHPESVEEEDLKITRETLLKLAKNKKVKAIGEIGLDYYWRKDESHVEKQKKFFIEQIVIANELHLPIIVHDREAHKDTLDILKQYPPLYGCVIHCFSGSVEMMRECINLGFYIGLDGPVTFKNAITPKEVAKAIPLDKLLLETDAPYLTPVPYRGQKNYPEYIKYIIQEIALLRNVSENEIEEQTFFNGKKFFGV
ncbi:MAG: TatD family hydrolase [Bacilli bacterium]